MINEMCQRVGLPLKVGSKIYALALTHAMRTTGGFTDMVLVAQAISYAGKNKHLLKEEWR